MLFDTIASAEHAVSMILVCLSVEAEIHGPVCRADVNARGALSSVHATRVHGPCSRVISTARDHGRYFGHPYSSAVDTGVVYGEL